MRWRRRWDDLLESVLSRHGVRDASQSTFDQEAKLAADAEAESQSPSIRPNARFERTFLSLLGSFGR